MIFPDADRRHLKVSAVFAIIAALLIAAAAVLEAVIGSFASSTEFIHAGDRWSADGTRYATFARYDEAGMFSEDEAQHAAVNIDDKLIQASITPNENARSWTYAYSTETQVGFTGPKSTVTANVTVCGGDFIVFHPFRFTYGTFFLNDASNPMGVVLDRDLAWKLFGAENIIGMTLSYGDIEYTVVGIAEQESYDGIYGETYGSTPRAYMSYAGYRKLGMEDAPVTVFEATLPNPVSGFGLDIFENCLGKTGDSVTVSEVSERYTVARRWERIGDLKYSLTKMNQIKYPFWENEARVYDYLSSVMTVIQLVLLIAAALCLLAAVISFATSGFSPKKSFKRLFRIKSIREIEV